MFIRSQVYDLKQDKKKNVIIIYYGMWSCFIMAHCAQFMCKIDFGVNLCSIAYLPIKARPLNETARRTFDFKEFPFAFKQLYA